jgi:hypothetical protein
LGGAGTPKLRVRLAQFGPSFGPDRHHRIEVINMLYGPTAARISPMRIDCPGDTRKFHIVDEEQASPPLSTGVSTDRALKNALIRIHV